MGRIKDAAIRQSESGRVQSCLGDLPDSVGGVFCWCNRCGHNAILPTVTLIAQFGPGFPVPEVGARMRCTGCGSKDVATRPDWPSLGQVTQHGADMVTCTASVQDVSAPPMPGSMSASMSTSRPSGG